MKQLMLTLIPTWWITLLPAQTLLTPIGKNTGVGGYSRHFQQVLSAWTNPAGLSCLTGITAGVYAENRFLLKDIPFYAAILAISGQQGTFSGHVVRLGNTAWYRQTVGLAYGRSLGKHIGAGLQFNYGSTMAQGVSALTAFSYTGGLLWHISEQFHTGVQIGQIVGQPPGYSGGIGFEASRDCLITGEVSRTGTTTGVKAAACYRIIRALALEVGIASRPANQYAAVAFYVRSLRIELSGGFHSQLGITPATSLIWQHVAE
ncbi:hypothetical protein ACDQ55_07455 [Chitinophaga sp. 30R24]|uniref:hypothetical protein n=1 Tax=Chitinophaga sp. 30R24 TaxID=3248838 RepID=UPI003B907C92